MTRIPLVLRALAAGLWTLLVLKLVVLSPPEHPQLLRFITDLATFQGNALEVAMFQCMGVLPLVYLRLLWHERGRPPAWPFLLGSFVLGGFVLLPYLVLQPRAVRAGKERPWQRSPWSARALAAVAGGLGLYGLLLGDVSGFIENFHQVKFIHLMSFDCAALALCLPFVWTSRRSA